jgi:hypothetical protein
LIVGRVLIAGPDFFWGQSDLIQALQVKPELSAGAEKVRQP